MSVLAQIGLSVWISVAAVFLYVDTGIGETRWSPRFWFAVLVLWPVTIPLAYVIGLMFLGWFNRPGPR